MNFHKLVEYIVSSVPEFGSQLTEKPHEDYSNAFLGDFGIFTIQAILTQKPYYPTCLITINSLVNENIEDDELINKIIVNTLEILTDKKLSQKAAVDYFSNNCLSIFLDLLNTQFVNLLDKD